MPLREQAPLEEGEVPWLMYNGETCSSSDEEDPEGMSHFVHPGLFILDGNNNLEDDSSVSEDLDAEWRWARTHPPTPVVLLDNASLDRMRSKQIGRASCRARV